MQYQDPPDTREVTPPIHLQSPTEFTMRPTGEMKVSGHPNIDLVEKLLTSSDYHRDQDRKYKSEIEKQATMTFISVIGFLSLSLLIAVISLINQPKTGGVNQNGQFLSGVSCR